MAVKIKPASEIEQYMKILVYGDPGVGKTTLAATAENHERMRKTLVVNVEGGMLSISGSGAMATEQVRSVAEVEELLWALSNRADGFEQYQTVVVDSGTELQTLDLEGIVKEARKKKTNRGQDDIYIEDYGKSTARLKRIFRHFRDLPMNVVITALTRRIMPPPDKSGSRASHPLAVMPQFTEKLSGSLMGYMDAVWYMYKDGDNRCILTQDKGPYKAKTRGLRFSKEIGLVVTNPDLSSLFDTLIETEGNKHD